LQGALVPPIIAAMASMASVSWTTPAFEEVRMDSEIGSYQEDRQEEREWPPTLEEAKPQSV
jgi:hypothetical protein